MTILVTGGTGFVGSNLVRALAETGHEILCFDYVPPNTLVKGFLKPWESQITFIQGDILDPDSVEKLTTNKITKIVHAAVFTGIFPEIEQSQSSLILETNIIGTKNMLELARQVVPERFLYVSSGSVYGEGHDPEEVLKETAELLPKTLYESTKYASELITRRYGELHGCETVSVRLSSPYGPMERITGHRANQSLLKELTGKVLRKEPLEIGDLSHGRDYTYITDIAHGILAVLEATNLSFDTYNVSSGIWITLEDIVNALKELKPDIQIIDATSKDIGALTGTLDRGPLDVTRLQTDIGHIAKYNLVSGLKEYIAWRQEFSFYE